MITPNTNPGDPNYQNPAGDQTVQQTLQEQLDAAAAKNAELQIELDAKAASQAQITSQFNDTIKSLTDNRNNQPAPIVAITPALSVDEVNEILQSGEGGDKLVTGLNKMMDQKFQQFQQEHIAPIRTEGASALSQIANTQAKNNTAEMPYYGRFEKEINDQLNKLPADMRYNPQAIKGAHDMVVGQNFSVVMQETQEMNLRKQQTEEQTLQQGQGQGRNTQQQQPQTLDESLSDVARSHLDSKGWNTDQYAQSQGFKDAADITAFNNDKDPNKTNYYRAKQEAANATQ